MYRHLRGKQRGFYLQSLSFSDYKAVVNCRLICAVAVGLKCCNNLRNLAYSILYSIRQWVLSVFQCSYYWKMHNLVVRTKAITKTFGVAKLLLISNFGGQDSVRFSPIFRSFWSASVSFRASLVGFYFRYDKRRRRDDGAHVSTTRWYLKPAYRDACRLPVFLARSLGCSLHRNVVQY